MQVNYYYHIGTHDENDGPEDGLLTLCAACAAKHRDEVQFAQRGDAENECEFCDEGTNDAERTAHLNALRTW